jgi:hypothetical protein
VHPNFASAGCGKSRWKVRVVGRFVARGWTKYKVEIEGRKARLYMHDASQPCLVVNDIKVEPKERRVVLWVGPGAEGYFAKMKITSRYSLLLSSPWGNMVRSSKTLKFAQQMMAQTLGFQCRPLGALSRHPARLAYFASRICKPLK